jgi:hypothetical protein
MYSYLSSQVAAERQRDLLADAAAERLARQARTGRRASQRAGWPRWRHRRPLRPATPVPA